jgi:hypothetical protein
VNPGRQILDQQCSHGVLFRRYRNGMTPVSPGQVRPQGTTDRAERGVWHIHASHREARASENLTVRFNHNQILYRLDLDDPALAPARGAAQAR